MKSASTRRSVLAGLAVTVLAPASAFAQTVQAAPAPAPRTVRLRGTIDSVSDSKLVLRERSGQRMELALAPTYTVTEVFPIALADIKPGSFVGVGGMPQPDGSQRAIESGSCSLATQQQVGEFQRAGGAAHVIEPLQLARNRDEVIAAALGWAQARLAQGPVLVYSTATPEAVRAVQQQLGVHDAGTLVEQALAAIGRGLVERGVRQLVVAGGETSGAVVQALGVQQMRIGPQIDPGVPWCFANATACDAQLHLALKSGNFGGPDFFHKSFKELA